jgi:hypothetical protein
MKKPRRQLPIRKKEALSFLDFVSTIQEGIRDAYRQAVAEGMSPGCLMMVLRMSSPYDRQTYEAFTGNRDDDPNHVHILPTPWMGGLRDACGSESRRALDECPSDMIRCLVFQGQHSQAFWLHKYERVEDLPWSMGEMNKDGTMTTHLFEPPERGHQR